METSGRRVTRSSMLEGESILAKKVKKSVKFDQPELNIIETNSPEDCSELNDEAGIQGALFSPLTPSFLLKSRHPLTYSWTFWYSTGNKDLT